MFQGLLVLRMHLPGDDEPFWAGAYTVQIAGRLDTDRIWKKARKAANKILAEYPAR